MEVDATSSDTSEDFKITSADSAASLSLSPLVLHMPCNNGDQEPESPVKRKEGRPLDELDEVDEATSTLHLEQCPSDAYDWSCESDETVALFYGNLGNRKMTGHGRGESPPWMAGSTHSTEESSSRPWCCSPLSPLKRRRVDKQSPLFRATMPRTHGPRRTLPCIQGKPTSPIQDRLSKMCVG